MLNIKIGLLAYLLLHRYNLQVWLPENILYNKILPLQFCVNIASMWIYRRMYLGFYLCLTGSFSAGYSATAAFRLFSRNVSFSKQFRTENYKLNVVSVSSVDWSIYMQLLTCLLFSKRKAKMINNLTFFVKQLLNI